ncbi:MAG: hypothetical protein MR850_02280 [Bacteroidales bacterium]|nr:hypothetical protein [Bacteroidales bacterium]
MANKMLFIPYLRKGYSRYIVEEDNLGKPINGGKTSTSINFRVEFDTKSALDNNQEETVSIDKEFIIAGPGEITNLDFNQIVDYSPKMGAVKMSMEYMPFIELADEDFPWRYTPLKATSQGKLRPWLTLLALKSDEFELKQTVKKQQYIVISSSNGLKGVIPEPTRLYELAHIHVNFDEKRLEEYNKGLNKDLGKFLEKYPERGVARLLCNRQLEPDTEYTAFVVPTFEQGRLSALGKSYEGVPVQEAAWDNPENITSLELPVYFKWTFTTGDAGFLTLARRLGPITDSDYRNIQAFLNVDIEGCGVMNTKESWIAGDKSGNSIIDMPAALIPLDAKEPSRFESIEVKKELRDLLQKSPVFAQNANQIYGASSVDDEDPWVVPPVYGARHKLALSIGSDDVVKELNLPLRNRIVAGLGAQAVRNNQEEFANRAWQQVEQVLETNQRIREAYQMEQVNTTADGMRSGRSRYQEQQNPIEDSRFDGLLSDVALRVTNQSRAYKNSVNVDSLIEKVPTIEKDILGRVDAKNGMTKDALKRNVEYESIETLQKDLGRKHPLVRVASGKANYFDVFKGYEFLRDILTVQSAGVEFSKTTMKKNGQGLSFTIEKEAYDYLTESKAGIKVNGGVNFYKILKSRVSQSDMPTLLNALLINVNYYKDFYNPKTDTASTNPIKYRLPIFLKVNGQYPGIVLRDDMYNQFLRDSGVSGGFVFIKVRIDDKGDTNLVVTTLNNLVRYGARFTMGNIPLSYNSRTKRFCTSEGGMVSVETLCLNNASRYEKDVIMVNSENPIKGLPSWTSLLRSASQKDGAAIIENASIINDNFWLPTNADILINKNMIDIEKCFVSAWSLAGGDDWVRGYGSWILQRQKEYLNAISTIENLRGLRGLKPFSFKRGRAIAKKYSSQSVREEIVDQYGISSKDLDVRISEKFPVLAYPVLPDPSYFYLTEQSARFMLPSVECLKNNTISCFYANPAFEEAYLAGMNTEMGKELLWREYPTDERGSYFRKFWDVPQETERIDEKYFDVKELHKWHNRLGKNHQLDTNRLIFVTNGDLLRFYPNTTVYLSSYNGGVLKPCIEPSVCGWLRDNTYLVGFDVQDEREVMNYYLTFEESDRTLRFSNRMKTIQTNANENGGTYAKNRRVEVTIYGLPVWKIIKK